MLGRFFFFLDNNKGNVSLFYTFLALQWLFVFFANFFFIYLKFLERHSMYLTNKILIYLRFGFRFDTIKYVLGLCLLTWQAQAQLPNAMFNDSLQVKPPDAHKLYFGFRNLNYFKNNEYFGKIADGYTLFGYQLNPKLIYFPSENLRVEAGAFIWKDFGNEKYTKILPTFSLKYQRDSLSFVFGNLEGSLQHGLIEPLYDFEKIMLDRLENGVQFAYKHRRAKVETWVDWQRMLYPAGKYQEEISGGLASEIYLLRNNAWRIGVPLQATVFHRGGQIDSVDKPLTSILNGSVGLAVTRRLQPSGFWRAVSANVAQVYYDNFSFEKQLPFSKGKGLYANISVDTKPFTLMLSYWNGDSYLSTRGGALYQSVQQAWRGDAFYKLSGQALPPLSSLATEKNREIVMLRLLHESKLLKCVYFSARFEPFYDLNNKKFEFSHGLYVTYRQNFFLKTITGE